MDVKINADLMIQILDSDYFTHDEKQKVKKILMKTINLGEKLVDYAEKNFFE